jgi:thioredoxin-like negative regulator of GroEL
MFVAGVIGEPPMIFVRSSVREGSISVLGKDISLSHIISDSKLKEYEGKAVVCKCNVDDCDDVPATYSIRSIPTLLFFKIGELVDRHVGVISKADLAAKLDALA